MATANRVSKANGDEFPILCETCLGPNPYIRMLKQAWGSACKVCERPFTSFRWRPAGPATRPKKTEICQTCARAKNVCQTCLLDLQFGLPVQVRDASLAAGDRQRAVVPQSDGTREYAAAMSERKIATGEIDAIYKAPMVNNIAQRAKRMAPKYERNLSRICSFYARGECTRGLYCPYRHEKPDDNTDGMSDQNLRDRYYGVNDPVAKKILQSIAVADGKQRGGKGGGKGNLGVPPVPEDVSIQTLFIGGLTPTITNADLRALFSKCEGLTDIARIPGRGFAFADFKSRAAAEQAIELVHGIHEVDDAKIRISWGKTSKKRPQSDIHVAVHVDPVVHGSASLTTELRQSTSAVEAAAGGTERSSKRARVQDAGVPREQPSVEGIEEQNHGAHMPQSSSEAVNIGAGEDHEKNCAGLTGLERSEAR